MVFAVTPVGSVVPLIITCCPTLGRVLAVAEKVPTKYVYLRSVEGLPLMVIALPPSVEAIWNVLLVVLTLTT